MELPETPNRKAGRVAWWRRGRKAVQWVGGLYLAAVVILVAGQDRLAFPGWTFRPPWQVAPPGAVVDEVTIPSADGNAISGWWLPPTEWTPQMGAVLYFHGNGENVSNCGRALRNFRNELHRGALGIDYPGYGYSTGTPSEQSCYNAALAAFDWLVREKKVAPQDIVVIGQSMGGAMATEVASRQHCRLLLTSSTFTSFPDVAQYRYFWLPARYLVHLRFDNLTKMRTIETPVFVAHGMADEAVPFSEAERLYAAVSKAPKRFYPRPGDGHSQPDTAAFYEAVREFLAETSKTSAAAR